MIRTAEDIRAQFPNKPIWLSEWSVDAGDNAISVLGQADTYLGIFDRPDLFESAEYFQIHNHDPLVIYDRSANPKHVKTSLGASYDILRRVFLNSGLLSGSMTSSQIVTGLDAATAQAVIKDGQLLVYAINKSPVSVQMDLDVDGAVYTGTYQHEALQFDGVNDFPSFDLSDSAMTLVTSTPGVITLPPLSISVLSGFDLVSPEAGSVVAGWDNFDGAGSPPPTTLAAGVTATAVVTGPGWFSNEGAGRGASKDATWGTFAGPAAADVLSTGAGVNLTLVNGAASGDLTFTVTNGGAVDLDLNSFHMDALAFRPNAARMYALNVLSGDMTLGNVFTSDAPANDNSTNAITHLAGGLLTDDSDPLTHDQHDDININMSGLADHTLAVGESAVIQIAFTGGTGSGNGHHLFIDNVAFRGNLEQAAVILGDVNLDGVVNFLDIAPFIGVLSGGTFQTEADVNLDGTVNFLDISPFISILAN
jgi:hypothetical protein